MNSQEFKLQFSKQADITNTKVEFVDKVTLFISDNFHLIFWFPAYYGRTVSFNDLTFGIQAYIRSMKGVFAHEVDPLNPISSLNNT